MGRECDVHASSANWCPQCCSGSFMHLQLVKRVLLLLTCQLPPALPWRLGLGRDLVARDRHHSSPMAILPHFFPAQPVQHLNQ